MKILLVDDNEEALRSLEELLSPPHTVVSALGGASGLEFSEAEDFDLVVTDYRMPDVTGVELLVRLRAKQPDMRVIFVTGYADVDNAIDALNEGAYAFFRKPLNVPHFMEVVQRVASELAGDAVACTHCAVLQRRHERLEAAYGSLVELVQRRSMDRAQRAERQGR